MIIERGIKYWVIVASKDYVKAGITAGIAQACHGKVAPLKRMRKGDFVLFYSGKQTMGKPDKCQEFTAIGEVKNEDTYAVPNDAGFLPFPKRYSIF